MYTCAVSWHVFKLLYLFHAFLNRTDTLEWLSGMFIEFNRLTMCVNLLDCIDFFLSYTNYGKTSNSKIFHHNGF